MVGLNKVATIIVRDVSRLYCRSAVVSLSVALQVVALLPLAAWNSIISVALETHSHSKATKGGISETRDK